VFPNGIPQITATVRGHAVYDPRDAGTRYTQNPALIARDYLLSPYGARVPAGELDEASFIAAANACEERVPMASYSVTVTADPVNDFLNFDAPEHRFHAGDGVQVSVTTGGSLPTPLVAGTTYYLVRGAGERVQLATSPANALEAIVINFTDAGSGTLRLSHVDQARYTCNGIVDTAREWPAVLEDILSSMAGRYSDSVGKQRVYAGVYQVPTLSFDEDDLRAPLDIQTRQRRQDVVNSVRGIYIDPTRDWQPTDFAPVDNATYRAADSGETLEAQVTWPMTLGEVRAQRLAKIVLETARQGISGMLPLMLNSRSMRILPHETLRLTVGALGWESKVFRVENWEFSQDGGIDLMIREEAAAVYAWSAGEATARDPAPDTSLPNPFSVVAPTALQLDSGSAQLLLGSDGSVTSRIRASWTPSTDPFLRSTELQYKRSSESGYQSLFLDDPTITAVFLAPVQDAAAYDVRVRAGNSIGVRSSWLEAPAHVVIGKTAAPSDVTGFAAVFNAQGVKFTWNAVPDADAGVYEIRVGESFNAGSLVWSGRGTSAQIGFLTPDTYNWHLKAIDTSLNASATAASVSLTVSAPSAVAPSGLLAGTDYRLDWNPSSASFPVARYEIRHGADFATGTFVVFADLTSFKAAIGWSGARTFWVAALDARGNTGAAGSVTLNVPLPAAPLIAVTYLGPDVVLAWDAPASGLPIVEYEIRHGVSWAVGTAVGRIKATRFALRVNWTGSRTFWVAALNSLNETGTEGSALVNPTPPGAPSITPKVANNLVGLTWSEAAGTLPVERYELRRGATFAGANSLGFLTARTATLFELLGATYTYWVAPYDSAGNLGTPASVTLLVSNPPNLTIFAGINSTFAGTLSSAVLEFGDVIFPVNTSETWQQHFDNNTWTTPQNQVDAGYEIYIEPAPASGYYEEQYDHGSSIASGNVVVNVTSQTLDGSPSLAGLISYKLNAGDAWTDVAGFTAAFTNGRYFKVRVTCSSTGGDDLASMDVLQWAITS
jgi:hypothetical protein